MAAAPRRGALAPPSPDAPRPRRCGPRRRPAGVALLGVNKPSRRYYERIVADAGVDPRDALVVDSHARPLEWADAVGFRTVHVDRLRTGSRFTRIASLDELDALLD